MTDIRAAFIAIFLAIASVALPANAANGPGKLSGTLDISQVQIAFIGSANLGSGHLRYRGRTYAFSVGGLGVGGFGISKMEAVGEIYGLQRLDQFSGAYGQARYGAVIGNASTGELWLQNSAGVYIHLKAKRQGLALSLGVDGVQLQLQ